MEDAAAACGRRRLDVRRQHTARTAPETVGAAQGSDHHPTEAGTSLEASALACVRLHRRTRGEREEVKNEPRREGEVVERLVEQIKEAKA